MTGIVTSIFAWSTLAASAFVSVMFLVNLLFFRKTARRVGPASIASAGPPDGIVVNGGPAMRWSHAAENQPANFALPLGGSRGTSGEGPHVFSSRPGSDFPTPSPAAAVSDPPNGRVKENVGDAPAGIKVSVLIPARNEAMRIGPLLDSVLASEGVHCDLCVLDDESQDGTDAIVEAYSRRHPNVRLLKGMPVPAGWSGKQFACYQLAQQAMCEELIFLDADVALSKDALQRAVTQRRRINADLLSGFPQQRVVTIGEQMLIPLIHVILLCFLPFGLMRWTRMTGAAAGCGQFFLTTKQAYKISGGHSSIRQSLHDGIMLPRAYRMSGLKTDLFDAADVATCRMYTSFAETWLGLMKNASEGFAKFPLLPVMTVLMLLAFVCPLLGAAAMWLDVVSDTFATPIVVACALSYLPRVLCCLKFDRAWLGCVLNPVSIVLFLIIQWIALIRKSQGKGVQWRQRSYEMVTS